MLQMPALSTYLITRWFKYDRDICGLFTQKSAPVIFEPPCISNQSTCKWFLKQASYDDNISWRFWRYIRLMRIIKEVQVLLLFEHIAPQPLHSLELYETISYLTMCSRCESLAAPDCCSCTSLHKREREREREREQFRNNILHSSNTEQKNLSQMKWLNSNHD